MNNIYLRSNLAFFEFWLPQHLHFPTKNASLKALENRVGLTFLAAALACFVFGCYCSLAFAFMDRALFLMFCSSTLDALSQPALWFLMYFQVTPSPRSSQYVQAESADENLGHDFSLCDLVELRVEYGSEPIPNIATMDSPRSWESLESSIQRLSSGWCSVIQLWRCSMHEVTPPLFGSGVREYQLIVAKHGV